MSLDGSKKKEDDTSTAKDPEVIAVPLTEEEQRDFEDLVYIAQKRNVKITIQRGAQAGIVAGLMVMGGVIAAGPVGAAVGGGIATGLAISLSKNVVSLKDLLQDTPPDKRRQVYELFAKAIREEFQDGFLENPELNLMLGGGTVISVVRYCLDRDIIENEKLEKLDGILRKIQ